VLLAPSLSGYLTSYTDQLLTTTGSLETLDNTKPARCSVWGRREHLLVEDRRDDRLFMLTVSFGVRVDLAGAANRLT
jgi:hypothetical protein